MSGVKPLSRPEQNQNTGYNDKSIRDLTRRVEDIEAWLNHTEYSVGNGKLVLLNGWAEGAVPVSVKLYGNGFVEFDGTLDATGVTSGSGAESVAFYLPQKCWPPFARTDVTYRSVDRAIPIAYVDVEMDGAVKPYFTTGDATISLEPIAYKAKRV